MVPCRVRMASWGTVSKSNRIWAPRHVFHAGL